MNRVVNEEYAKRLQAVLVRSLVETGLFHDIPSDQDREFLLEFMMSNEERLGRGLPIAPDVVKVVKQEKPIEPRKSSSTEALKKKKPTAAETKKKKETSAKKKIEADARKEADALEESRRKFVAESSAVEEARRKLEADMSAIDAKRRRLANAASALDADYQPDEYPIRPPSDTVTAMDNYIAHRADLDALHREQALKRGTAAKKPASRAKPKVSSGAMDLAEMKE